MNFMSYMAEVSRGWDEPNARDMGRMMSQPNAKGEMYILNDNIDMRTKFAAMARRLEKLEMTNMQLVQAISQTPLQAMPCAICLSYEHLVDKCPTIPAERKCLVIATPTIPIEGPSKFLLKPHHLKIKNSLKHHSKPQTLNKLYTLNKRMDECKMIYLKIDSLQDSISRFANLNIVQEKENFPSQPYQNSMSIHEVEALEENLQW
ncbi:hypothetical protein AAG906_008117 [Vitis piasezkii]